MTTMIKMNNTDNHVDDDNVNIDHVYDNDNNDDGSDHNNYRNDDNGDDNNIMIMAVMLMTTLMIR